MERLLVLRLESLGVAAEAWINGVPVARKAAAAPAVTVPVHEYAVAGANTIALVLDPPPATEPLDAALARRRPRIGDGSSAASLKLLLPRAGHRAHPEFARTLAQIDWAALRGELVELPQSLERTVELPIGFPRWRWLDAPVVADPSAWVAPALALLQAIALGLARGDPEPFVQAARLRFEELAEAYRRPLADEVGRFRVHVQQAHAAEPLLPPLPSTETLRLRPVAGGRLLECRLADGGPALACPRADGSGLAWPLRLAAIDSRLYVLR